MRLSGCSLSGSFSLSMAQIASVFYTNIIVWTLLNHLVKPFSQSVVWMTLSSQPSSARSVCADPHVLMHILACSFSRSFGSLLVQCGSVTYINKSFPKQLNQENSKRLVFNYLI